MGVEDKKASLISSLLEVRTRILSLAGSIHPDQRDEVYLGTWSSRQMLAHLAGWDEANIQALAEIQTDTLPSFYAHSDTDWASYNALLVDRYSRDNWDELIALVESTHESLIHILQALPALELWKDRGIRARGWKVTIGRLLEAELGDEEEHLRQLKAFVDEGLKT